MKISDYSQSWPFWYYRRVQLINPTEYAYFYLPNGINYQLNKIAVTYPAAGALPSPEPKLELFWGERDAPTQQDATPFNLVSSPGEVSSVPGIQAGARKLLYKWDYLFLNSGMIKIAITGQTGGNPSRIDIMIEGRSIVDYAGRAVQ